MSPMVERCKGSPGFQRRERTSPKMATITSRRSCTASVELEEVTGHRGADRADGGGCVNAGSYREGTRLAGPLDPWTPKTPTPHRDCHDVSALLHPITQAHAIARSQPALHHAMNTPTTSSHTMFTRAAHFDRAHDKPNSQEGEPRKAAGRRQRYNTVQYSGRILEGGLQTASTLLEYISSESHKAVAMLGVESNTP